MALTEAQKLSNKAMAGRLEKFYPESMSLKKNLAQRAKDIGYSKSSLVNAAVKQFLQNDNQTIMHAIIGK